MSVWRGGLLGRVVAPVLVGLPLLAFPVSLAGCKKPYRVGEYVLVEWEEGQPPYPAYILERKGKTRYKVHFDGYESRWDEEVNVDSIVGRVQGPITPPPPPARVARAAGIPPSPSGSATTKAPYRVGDRVRVKWRGSVYNASIVGVVASDRFLIHYDGHESAWDEVIHIDRIVSRR